MSPMQCNVPTPAAGRRGSCHVFMSVTATQQKAGQRSLTGRELARPHRALATRQSAPELCHGRDSPAPAWPASPRTPRTRPHGQSHGCLFLAGSALSPSPAKSKAEAKVGFHSPPSALRRPPVCVLCPPRPRNVHPPVWEFTRPCLRARHFDLVSFCFLCSSLVPPVNSQAQVTSWKSLASSQTRVVWV